MVNWPRAALPAVGLVVVGALGLAVAGLLSFGGMSEQAAEAAARRASPELHGGRLVAARKEPCAGPPAAGLAQPESQCRGQDVWLLSFDMRPCRPGGTATYEVMVDSMTGKTVYESGQMC